MDIVAHLINVEYKYEEEYFNENGIALKVKNIVVLPDIDEHAEVKDDFSVSLDIHTGIVMNTHQTYKNKGLYQLGLEIKNGEKYSCKCRVGNKYVSKLRYNKENSIFFDTNIYTKDYRGRFILVKDRATPFDTAGTYNIDILLENVIVKTISVNVNPSSITFEDYERMIEDLRSLREGLFINSKSKIGLFKKWKSRIEYIDEKLADIEKVLRYIDKKPKSTLKRHTESMKFEKIKKVNSNILRDKYIYPHKQSFPIDVAVSSYDIYEHRAMKTALLQIKERLKKYIEQYSGYIDEKSLEVNEFFKEYEDATNNDIRNRYDYLKAERDKVFKTAESIQSSNTNIFNLYKNLVMVGFNVEKTKGIGAAEDKVINEEGLEINGINKLFSFKIESAFNKYSKEFELTLSRHLGAHNNLKSFYYCDLLRDKDGRIIKSQVKEDKLKSKKFSCRITTSNINEIIFLYEQLTDKKICTFDISAVAKKDMASDYIFGGEDNGSYRIFTMDLVKIISINNNKVPDYPKSKIQNFIESKIVNIEKFSDEYNLIKSIITKEEIIKQEKSVVLNNKCSFNSTISKLEEINKLSIFGECNEKNKYPLRPTQVFINDMYYRKAYKLLKALDDDIKFSFEATNEAILVNSTQNIYEIWSLFAIVDTLISELEWELINKNEIKKILDNIIDVSNVDVLKNLKIELEYKYKGKKVLHMNLLYEPKIVYGVNKYKTPDFKLELFMWDKQCNNFKGPWIMYLDSKYRDYNVQGYERTFINKDIEGVALKKYFETFICTEHEPLASMIIHSCNNTKYVEFSGNKSDSVTLVNGPNKKIVGPHKYGGFPLVPSNKQHLKTFFKMIFEYHLSIYGVCWNCGCDDNVERVTKKTVSGYEKYYFTCNSCNEFWVKTHCSQEGCNRDLVKHTVNYHNKVSSNHWNVVCPCCNDVLVEYPAGI